MAKGDKFYFENLSVSAALSKEAADYLANSLENYDANNLKQMVVDIHEIEHNADIKKHEMNEALAKAFVTPVDREDLDMLSHNLDHVTDKIEEVIQKFYIYDIQSVTPDVIDFAKKIVNSCEMLCELMGEFENFKRSKKIQEFIVKLNDAEEECDKLYLSAMHKLTKESKDVLVTISLREIFDCFEKCADACEHVGECVGTVVMKNT